MTSGEAKITIRDNKIDKIAFNNYYPGMRGSLGYTCSIDVSRENSDYAWQDMDTGARVSTKDAGDAFTLSRNKKGYLLSFKSINTLSRFCGAGAELPDDVLIPHSGKSCIAKIPK
ncbi:MAG: hypothetical protein PHE55_20400 [Methylococcaceae bacterium]|nr:hypothetical protein [Methylococcaceae bacterium]